MTKDTIRERRTTGYKLYDEIAPKDLQHIKKKVDYLASFYKNEKRKMLALDIFRLLRPFSRVQIDN